MSMRSHRPSLSPASPAGRHAQPVGELEDFGSNAEVGLGLTTQGAETSRFGDLLGSGSLGGLQAPLTASPSDPVAPADSEKAALALRMAVDILQGGTWHSGQAAPEPYSSALADLESVQHPLHPVGRERLDLATRGIAGMEEAARVVDAGWVEAYWRPLAAKRLAAFRKEVALDHLRQLSPDAAAPGAPASDAHALLPAYDDLTEATWKVDAWIDTKALEEARRLAAVVEWQTALGRPIVDPVTGAVTVLSPTGKAIDEFLRLGKTALKLAAVSKTASTLGDEPAQPEAAGAADALTLVKRAGDAAVVVAAIIAETSALVARGFALVAATPEAAASYRATAEACRSTAGAIHTSAGVTAAMGFVDLATSAVVLLDDESTDEQKLTAGIKAITAGAKIGAATAGIAAKTPGALEGLVAGTAVQRWVEGAVPRLAGAAPALTAVSFAVPAGWWIFETSMRAMAATSVDIAQGGIVTGLGDLIDPAERLSAHATVLLLAGELADGAEDPSMALAYLDARESYVGDVLVAVKALLDQAHDFRSPEVERVFDEVTARHAGLGAPGLSADQALLAAADLLAATRWCLDNAQALAAAEVGLRPAPRPEAGRSLTGSAEAAAGEEPPECTP